jgi:hypothetical protein
MAPSRKKNTRKASRKYSRKAMNRKRTLRKMRGGSSGASGSSVPSVPSAVSRSPVDLYYSIGGRTSEGVNGIILAAHSTDAPTLTKTNLITNGWMVNTQNSRTVFNRDQIKFPATFPTDVRGFTCSTWNGTAWTPRNFVNPGGTNGFSLRDRTGRSLYTAPPRGTLARPPATLNLPSTVVTGLWDGFSFGTLVNNKKIAPPAGTTILSPNTTVNLKISFTV